ncbi:hypothetical protein V8C86DRAFT_2923529, partial [Haematococcus lacustris]
MLRHSIPLLLAMSGALVCCAAAGAWGADLLDVQPSDTRRSLQQQPNTFPFASCTSYSCLASPYYLEPPSITAITANLALVCLRLRLRMATNTTVTTTTSSGGSGGGGAGGQRLCSAAQGPCCSQLASSLHQISIRTSARCSSAITNVLLDNQATNYAVTSVGGSRDAAIVVSPLSLSGANAEGRLLCLTVRPPCTDTGLLFAGQPL